MRRIGFAALGLTAFLAAGDAEAAKFRLQSSTAQGDGQYNYGNLTFTIPSGANAGTYAASGEFAIATDYKDSSGNTVSGTYALQAWKINIFKDGAGAPLQFNKNIPGLASTSSGVSIALGSPGVNTIELTCTDVSVCGNTGITWQLQFNTPFNDAIRDSTGSLTPLATTSIQSVTVGGEIGTSLGGQADFVPVTPGLVSFIPLSFMIRRLFSKSTSFNDLASE